MKVSDFDYYLPEELIAQSPLACRDKSRLLVVNRKEGKFLNQSFCQLSEFLAPGDLLVLNNTRVLSARLYGMRPTGGLVEVLLLTSLSDNTWSALAKPARRLPLGSKIHFESGLEAEITGSEDEGIRHLTFNVGGSTLAGVIARIGQTPLPPYIREKIEDPERYQTIYSEHPGAVAAPTAGLHFTQEVFASLKAKGIDCTFVTLHVGLGTFRPVSAELVEEHKMHSEYFEVSPEAAEKINAVRARGGRIVAVGTTSVRVLESASNKAGGVSPGTGWTDIFIYPGYKFKSVDALITNFHLPKSSLLMLVSALSSRDLMLAAYQHGVTEQYRFFSFGDAMLII